MPAIDSLIDALEVLDRAFDAWHDGEEPKARSLARDVDGWLNEAKAGGFDEEHPRTFELVRGTVTDMFAAKWQAAGVRLDTLDRLMIDDGRETDPADAHQR